MVERAHDLPSMAFTDPKEYLARMAEEENNDWDEEELKEKETVLMEIGKKYRDDGNAKDLEIMIKMIRPFTKLLSKAKAAKLIRLLVDMYLDMESSASSARAETAVELCKECISWATEEKRIFLRQVRSQIRVSLLIVVRKKCDSNQYVLF